MYKNSNKQKIMYIRSSTIPLLQYILFTIILQSLFSICDAYCPQHFFWDQTKDNCVECSKCDNQEIVIRPCQPHRDTVCGTFEDIGFEFDFLSAAQKQVAVADWEQERLNQLTENDPNEMLDWQAIILVLAAFACILFFLVAACIFWNHYRYWKKMERMERGYNAVSDMNTFRMVSSRD